MKRAKNLAGKLEISVTSNNIEKLLNMLWSSNIGISNLKRNTVNSIMLEINVKDYEGFLKCVKQSKSRYHIVKRSGPYIREIAYRKKASLGIGVIFFFMTLGFLKSYIWGIEISTEENVSPFEIREFLKGNNITVGLKKNHINLADVEEKLNMEHPEIVWSKARIYGSTLKIEISEKKNPPEVIEDDYPSDFVASKDGEILRVYTEAGNSKVKAGQMVKKGDLLVEGVQGKEGAEYVVNSDGKVIAKTFYEKMETFNKKETVRKRTGKVNSQIYFEIMGKKIFLKNKLNNFENYDKIIDNTSFLKKITYYEVIEEEKEIEDAKTFVETVHNQFYNDITIDFNREIEVLDVIKDYKETDDKITVRVVVIAQENIAEEVKMSDEKIEKYRGVVEDIK